MDLRYFQEFYCVELIEVDIKGRCVKTLESYYSLNRRECVELFNKHKQNNTPARFKKVYAEVDIDGAIIDIVHVIEEIDFYA